MTTPLPPTLARRGCALLTALLIGALCIQALAADFQTGLEAYKRGYFAAALREWRPLAEEGHAEAQYRLGLMYDFGLGVPEADVEAVKWHRMAAEQGFAQAQYILGDMYREGIGVPEDDAKAIEWYRKVAQRGDSEAQFRLGLMYDDGEGVPEDDVQAYAWFNIAAAQGGVYAEIHKKIVAELMTREELGPVDI